MSKTYGNTVDLTEDPVPMFFKLTLVQDAALPKFMRLLTDRSDDEIAAVEARTESEHNLIDARQQFAHDIVSTLYDAKAADEAQQEFERVVSEGELPSDIPDLQVPTDIERDGEVGLVDLLAASDLIQSKGDARRLVQQGGIRINGEVVTDPRVSIPATKLAGALVKIGKRGYVRVRVE